MSLIGITGGIAAGKSTVTHYLRQKGYVVIDADALVHQWQQKGGILYQAIVQAFGNDLLDTDGQLDRKALSNLVFSDPVEKQRLSSLQDQVIRDQLAMERDRSLRQESVVFMDIPLLFELSYEEWFDQIWLVMAADETRLKRLMERNHLTKEEAASRMAAQLPQEEKRKRAHRLIDNGGDRAQTYKQVDHLLSEL